MYQRFSEYIGSPLDAWTIEYRVHATQQMFKRGVNEKDVRLLLAGGTIIEYYHDDFPFPSLLIYGVSNDNRPLHAIVGIDVDMQRLYLITVYEPDPEKWSSNFTRRR